MKTLVILAHPDMENSRINKRWKEELEKYPDKITVNELYKNYPNWDIDIEREHKLLLSHDNIIIQFPLYWYTYTPLLKKWLDDVLSYNWAYGNEYNLKGKNIGVAISIGGFESDYSKTGSVKFSMDEILIHFKATVISGCPESSATPFEDRMETVIPLIIATHPIGDLKALNKWENPISPVAIGIKMATVITKTPQLIPFSLN